jgi:hypothetical protein
MGGNAAIREALQCGQTTLVRYKRGGSMSADTYALVVALMADHGIPPIPVPSCKKRKAYTFQLVTG